MTKNLRATEEWRKLVASLVPEDDPMRDLLLGVDVVTEDTATARDYIICGTHAVVPSDNVECSICSTPLCRSKQAPTKPQPICFACVPLIES